MSVSSESDQFSDAEARLEAAKDRLQQMYDEWEASGRQLIAYRGENAPFEHPYVKMIRETEAHIVKLAAEVKKAHRGPVPSAVPTIRKPKSANLRAVG